MSTSTVYEQVARQLRGLNEQELLDVAQYVSFLAFRARHRQPFLPDEAEMKALYAEFADEDRALAEEGMAEYHTGLAREDAA